MKKLRLKQDILTELTSDEARSVAGANATLAAVNSCGTCATCQSCLTDCAKLTCGCTQGCYDTINTCYVTCGCVTATA